MKNASVLRITGDLCLWFSLISSFKYFAEYAPLMGVFLLFAVLGLSLAVRLPHPAMRILPGLLPALTFIWVRGLYGFIIFGIALLYYILTVIPGRFRLLHWEYQRIYRVEMLLGLLLMGVGAGRKLPWPVLYAFLFLLFGVIALRNLRMGTEMPMKWRGLNLLEVFVPLGLAAGASYLFWIFLRAVKNFMTVLMAPEIAGILLFEKGMEKFIRAFQLGFYGDPKAKETVAETTEAATKALEEAASNDTDIPKWMERISFNWILLLLLLIAAAAALLIFVMVRRHRKEEAPEDILYEEGSAGGGHRRKRRKKERNASNAEQVRRIYREYMELLRTYGVVRKKDTTSGDLLYESSDLFSPEPNGGLREIYLKARYGRGESVTDEERKRAEAYLENMRKNK